MAVRLGAVCTRKGAPSSRFRLESAVSSLRPPRRHLYTLYERGAAEKGRVGKATHEISHLRRAHLPSARIPPLHSPSLFFPLLPRASYQPATTTRAFAIVSLLCRCYRGVSVRLYKGDSFSGKYQFLRRMNFDSRERVKPLRAGEVSPPPSPIYIPPSLSVFLVPSSRGRELSLPWTFHQTNT